MSGAERELEDGTEAWSTQPPNANYMEDNEVMLMSGIMMEMVQCSAFFYSPNIYSAASQYKIITDVCTARSA